LDFSSPSEDFLAQDNVVFITIMKGEIAMTTSKVSQKTRCSHCGRIGILDMRCTFCGISEAQQTGIVTQSRKDLSIPYTSASPSVTGSIIRKENVPATGFIQEQKQHRPNHQGSELRGRVIIAQQASQEPMDFDPWRWVAIPVWGIVLLMSPVILGIIIWKTSGFLVSMLIAFLVILTLRFIFSNKLLQSWHLVAAFNGRRIVESMPVLMVRLRTSNNREIQMKLKGQLSGGILMEGDRIIAQGAWSNGAFKPRRIFCERTHATITPRQPNALIIAVCGFFTLLILSLWLYFSGIPWASSQITQFRGGIEKQQLLPHNHNLRP